MSNLIDTVEKAIEDTEQVIVHDMHSIYKSLQSFLAKIGLRHAEKEIDGHWTAEDQKAWQDACIVHGLPVNGTETPHSEESHAAFMDHPIVKTLLGDTSSESDEDAEAARLAAEAESARLAAEAEANRQAAEAARLAAEKAAAEKAEAERLAAEKAEADRLAAAAEANEGVDDADNEPTGTAPGGA